MAVVGGVNPLIFMFRIIYVCWNGPKYAFLRHINNVNNNNN